MGKYMGQNVRLVSKVLSVRVLLVLAAAFLID
jgi:uncharacterized membrane protein AbrB (regulator of aidB expression)